MTAQRQPKRRRDDQRTDRERIAELTSEQRCEIFLRKLKADIAAACAYFWSKRETPEPFTSGEWTGSATDGHTDDSNAASEATDGKNGAPVDAPIQNFAKNFRGFESTTASGPLSLSSPY